VHRPDSARRVLVSEDSLHRVGREHEDVSRRVGLRQLELLVVDEEEGLLAVLEEVGYEYRPADVAAELTEQEVVTRQPVNVVEVVIRVELRRAVLPERAAVEFGCPRLCDEANLHRALARALRAGHSRRDRDLLYGVGLGLNLREESVGAA